MIVALSRRFEEMSIYGTPADYRQLAEIIRHGEGQVDLDAEADVDPYDEPLARIVVHRTETTTVIFRRADRDMVLTGPPGHLGIVATIFDEAADQDGQNKHVHIDPFPGHYFLDESSASVILNDPGPSLLGAAYRKSRSGAPPAAGPGTTPAP